MTTKDAMKARDAVAREKADVLARRARLTEALEERRATLAQLAEQRAQAVATLEPDTKGLLTLRRRTTELQAETEDLEAALRLTEQKLSELDTAEAAAHRRVGAALLLEDLDTQREAARAVDAALEPFIAAVRRFVAVAHDDAAIAGTLGLKIPGVDPETFKGLTLWRLADLFPGLFGPLNRPDRTTVEDYVAKQQDRIRQTIGSDVA